MPAQSVQIAGLERPIGAYSPTGIRACLIELIRKLSFGNGVLRKYGARLLRRLDDDPIDYDYFGLTLRHNSLQDGSTRHMLLSPTWSEHKERSFLIRHLPDTGTFIDIGAHTGCYTFFVSALRSGCTVIAVEPAHQLAASLDFNARANKLERVHIEDVALSDRVGVASFNSDTESMLYGSRSVNVRTTTLQQLATDHGITRIDALKIDVEGMEDRVLMPFFRSAPRSLWPKAIVIEHACSGHWKEDCLDFAKRNGYRETMRSKLNAALVLQDS